jgi:hypothetical protein
MIKNLALKNAETIPDQIGILLDKAIGFVHFLQIVLKSMIKFATIVFLEKLSVQLQNVV